MLSRSIVPVSVLAHELWPTRLLCPWDSAGKSTGVGCHFLLQGIFPTQGSNLHLCISCAGRWILYLWPPGKNLPANTANTRDAGAETMNIIQVWNKNILPVWQICPKLQSYSGLETSPVSRSVHLGAYLQGSQEGEGWSQKGWRRHRWRCRLSWRLWRQSALTRALKQNMHPGPGPWSGTSCQSVISTPGRQGSPCQVAVIAKTKPSEMGVSEAVSSHSPSTGVCTSPLQWSGWGPIAPITPELFFTRIYNIKHML